MYDPVVHTHMSLNNFRGGCTFFLWGGGGVFEAKMYLFCQQFFFSLFVVQNVFSNQKTKKNRKQNNFSNFWPPWGALIVVDPQHGVYLWSPWNSLSDGTNMFQILEGGGCVLVWLPEPTNCINTHIMIQFGSRGDFLFTSIQCEGNTYFMRQTNPLRHPQPPM